MHMLLYIWTPQPLYLHKLYMLNHVKVGERLLWGCLTTDHRFCIVFHRLQSWLSESQTGPPTPCITGLRFYIITYCSQERDPTGWITGPQMPVQGNGPCLLVFWKTGSCWLVGVEVGVQCYHLGLECSCSTGPLLFSTPACFTFPPSCNSPSQRPTLFWQYLCLLLGTHFCYTAAELISC